MGGVGKTTLAISLAVDSEIRQKFSNGVFWFSIGIQSVSECKDQLHKNINQLKRLYKLRPSDIKILVILDNVDSQEHINPFTELLSANSHLLLTSRNRKLLASYGASLHPIGPVSEEQGLEILAKATRTEEVNLPPLTREIIRSCGNLPLAIAMIGSMVEGYSNPAWRAYLDRLRQLKLEKIFWRTSKL